MSISYGDITVLATKKEFMDFGFNLSDPQLATIVAAFSRKESTGKKFTKLFQQEKMTLDLIKTAKINQVLKKEFEGSLNGIIFCVIKKMRQENRDNEIIRIIKSEYPELLDFVQKIKNRQDDEQGITWGLNFMEKHAPNVPAQIIIFYILNIKQKYGPLYETLLYEMKSGEAMFEPVSLRINFPQEVPMTAEMQLFSENPKMIQLIHSILYAAYADEEMYEELKKIPISDDVINQAVIVKQSAKIAISNILFTDSATSGVIPSEIQNTVNNVHQNFTPGEISIGSIIQFLVSRIVSLEDTGANCETCPSALESKTTAASLEKCQKENQELQNRIRDYEEKIAVFKAAEGRDEKQKRRIAVLESRVREQENIIHYQQNQTDLLIEPSQSADEIEPEDEKCKDEIVERAKALSQFKKVMVVGGHPNWKKNVRTIFPDITIFPAGERFTPATVSQADLVLIKYDYVRHSDCNKAKSICDANSIDLWYAQSGQSIFCFAQSLIYALEEH